MKDFDIIIIGAGSAGCIVASQLINNTNYKVLLIEAGSLDNNPIISVPLGYGMTFYNKKVNWNFYSKKQENLFNREIYFPRGKVLGGSGSINGLVYFKGLKTDFQDWSKNQNNAWSWKSISETYNLIQENISISKNPFPENKIPVNDVSKLHHSIIRNFFKAAEELNIKVNKNFSTTNENQFGHYNINTNRGIRYSSAKSFLKPILKNSRLKLLKNCIVKKILFEGKKASGLEVYNKKIKMIIKPKIGVILSSGAIMTPYLLMHSGVGNGKNLKNMNIDVNIDNPNVGQNLQDHIGIDYLYKTNIQTLNYSLGTYIGRAKSLSNYIFNRKGPFSLSINQSGGFINWQSHDSYPNLQIYFNPLTYSVKQKNKRPLLQTDKFNGFIIGFNSCRPKSLGSISLKNSNFNEEPIIDPNYLDNYKDIEDLYSAFNFIKKITSTESIKDIITNPVNINPLKMDKNELLNHFKLNASSVYHPCGTCKMDDDFNKGVVSTKLKLHGSENLWIVDASVFPNITSGNINAPVMMLAHLGTKLIIEELKGKK